MRPRIYFLLSLLTIMFSYSAAMAQNQENTVPTEVMLSIAGDPASEYAVTWRTAQAGDKAVAQIVKADPDPKFEEKAAEVQGTTVEGYGDSKSRATHKVLFTRLQPGTLYSYRVGNGSEWSEWFQFKTACKTNKKFSFLYLGDVQNNIKSLGSRTLRQAYKHFGSEASFMLFAGDLVSRSTDDYWSEFFYAGNWIFGSLPSVPTPGNHEYNKVDDKRIFSNHWNHIYGMPQNAPSEEYQNRFYWFDYQGVRFVSIDSPVFNKDNKDLRMITDWLENTLKNNPNRGPSSLHTNLSKHALRDETMRHIATCSVPYSRSMAWIWCCKGMTIPIAAVLTRKILPAT